MRDEVIQCGRDAADLRVQVAETDFQKLMSERLNRAAQVGGRLAPDLLVEGGQVPCRLLSPALAPSQERPQAVPEC
jgi:hypothetical protein